MFDLDSTASTNVGKMEARAMAAGCNQTKPLGFDDMLTFGAVLVVGLAVSTIFAATMILGIKVLGGLFGLMF